MTASDPPQTEIQALRARLEHLEREYGRLRFAVETAGVTLWEWDLRTEPGEP